jgi:hypothetical protein
LKEKISHQLPMKQNRKGFSALFVIGAVLAIGGLLLLANYAYHKSPADLGGAQVYQTQLSDTFNTFRQQVNSSTQNLNTELETVSGTIAAYGTITSQNIPLPANAGGTGTTTLPSNAQFLSASGTAPTWKTVTFGAGMAVTTTATSVAINTNGIDQTANYAWSGNNTHSGSETFNSSTAIGAGGTLTDNASTTFNSTTTFTTYPIFKVRTNSQFFAPASLTSTSNATSTWTCPTGVTTVYVTEVGGGGSGGTANTSVGTSEGGGGSGGLYVLYPTSTVPGTIYNIQVGGGGLATTTSGTAGTAGGNSFFGGLIATGGGAGTSGGAGANGSPNSSFTMNAAGYNSNTGGAGASNFFGNSGAAASAGAGPNPGTYAGAGGGGGAYGTPPGLGGNGAPGFVIIQW